MDGMSALPSASGSGMPMKFMLMHSDSALLGGDAGTSSTRTT